MNCSDGYCTNYGCNQGRDCPVRTSKVMPAKVTKAKPVMRAADPLPPSIWRYQLKKLAYWILLAILGVTLWPTFIYLVLRLS